MTTETAAKIAREIVDGWNDEHSIPMSLPGMRAALVLQKENARQLFKREEFLSTKKIAALIDRETAAPELLDALEKLVQATDDWNAAVESVIGRQPKAGLNDALELARAAISKAKGRK